MAMIEAQLTLELKNVKKAFSEPKTPVPLSMPGRSLTARELIRWRDWFRRSHGMIKIPSQTVRRFDMDYCFYGVQLTSLPRLRLWLEPDQQVPLIAFQPFTGIRTVSQIFDDAHPARVTGKLSHIRLCTRMQKLVHQRRIWWGTESLSAAPWLTTIAYVMPAQQS